MAEASQPTFAALLAQARRGDASAIGTLFPLVYGQLKRVARAQRRRRTNETLSTTAVVHEAYIRLAGARQIDVRDWSHFMAVAALAMRQVLVDHARARLTTKRGGGARTISFDEIEVALESGPDFTDGKAEALLALDNSLSRLAEHSKRQARVVECRFYAGLTVEKTAQALGISQATVKRDWSLAQAWLYHDLREALA